MKKFLVILTALAVVFGVTAAAHAAGVQVTLTSPTIVKEGCERAGSVTFGFENTNQINAGDWWYLDLPSTVTICKPIDYFITGGGVDNVTGGTVNIAGGTTGVVLAGGAVTIAALAPGTNAGPISVTNLGGGVAPTLTGNIVFRVQAAANTRRVFVQAYGGTSADSILVNAGTVFNIKVLNGNIYNGFITMNTDGDLLWGDDKTGSTTSDDMVGPLPDVNNTLCINAENYVGGDLVFVSFDSRASEFTFSGDSQIAHTGAASQIALAHCKGDITGNILIGGQNSCSFDYESPSGYCTFTGNRILIDSSTTFGDPGELWNLTITSDTPGVYFSGAPVAFRGFTPAQDACTLAGANVTAGAWVPYTASGVATAGYPGTTCSVSSTQRVVKLATALGAISAIQTYDRLWVDLNDFVYDTSIIGNGTEVEVTFTLGKYPCGDIWSEQMTVGTFVTSCGAAAVSTTLMYPFLPALDGSMPGWWGGFTVNNAGTAAGTAVLTFWESDGDTATYTTGSIAAGRMWTMAAEDLLAAVTPGAANTGTFGDSNVMVTVVCNFTQGGGFAFTGNGEEGTGYTAYVLNSGLWQ